MSEFKLGQRSRAELDAVHPDLVATVERAIELTTVDFAVHDGIRSIDDQRRLVAAGASKTLHSRHLTGHAVDLVPYVNGKLRWEWDAIYSIAEAVRTAANAFDVPIRWGGAWHLLLTDSELPPEDLVANYVEMRRRNGQRAFIDGPHFELPREKYPA